MSNCDPDLIKYILSPPDMYKEGIKRSDRVNGSPVSYQVWRSEDLPAKGS